MKRVPGEPRNATALSHPEGRQAPRNAGFFGLARRSHPLKAVHSLAGLSLLLAGCLAPTPTEFRKPEKTTPVLDLATALPVTTQLLLVNNGDAQPFRVKVRSEDDGDDVFGALHLDYGLKGGPRFTGGLASLPPSTFEDTQREMAMIWPVNATSGCHQLTMFVTHQLNFDVNRQLPKNATVDTAIAVWWVHVDSDASDAGPFDMPPCPDPIPLVPEAGTGT